MIFMNKIRKKIILFMAFMLPSLISAQTANYVSTVSYLDGNGSKSMVNREYYNGIGKKISEVSSNTLGGFSHAYALYDDMGRISQQWQPMGNNAISNQSLESFSSSATAFYGDQSPYTQYEYDVLGRIESQTGAGEQWHKAGKKVTTVYTSNAANSVICYEAPIESNSLVENGCYAAATLHCEQTTDEDGHVLEVFTNLLGQKVLERRNGNNDTYYVYNLFGELRFVLPPSYQDGGMVESDAYEYRYDDRGRMIYKKIPSKEYEAYWYDRGNRLAKMQDGALRSKGLYRFTLYDSTSRVCLQGTCTAFDMDDCSATVTFSTGQSGICGTGYSLEETCTLSSPELELSNYYNDYNCLSTSLFKGCSNVSKLKSSSKASAIGFQTASITKDTDGEYVFEVNYYNERGLVIDAKKSYPSGHLLSTKTEYTFTKKPSKVTESVDTDGKSYTTTSTYFYNTYNDELENVTLNCMGKTQVVAKYVYDAVGRKINVTKPSAVGIESYTYNVRGWMEQLSSRSFFEKLFYEKAANNPCFNGNIACQQWQTGNESILRGYDFAYDNLNRLVSSHYGEGQSLEDNKGRYDETVGKYNANGAIMLLQRNGKLNDGNFGVIDNLTYILDGNRPMSISDAATSLAYFGSFDFKDNASQDIEYEYDANGSLIRDANKGVTIAYDKGNMPMEMNFGNGKRILYNFSAIGEKLQVKHVLSEIISTTDYVGPYIFTNGSLDKFLFDGGYCTFESSTPTFHYYSKDHLGNIRVVTDENGKIEQTIHYYPFGGIFADADYQESLQAYKYNGKEFERMHGLDWYDYGARMYDAAIGCWNGVDVLSEKYYPFGQYAYCFDSPINCIDFDGNRVIPQKYINRRYNSSYHSSEKIAFAMRAFAKTTFGRQILADFTSVNSYIYGVKGNGKYADFDLKLQECEFTKPDGRIAFFFEPATHSMIHAQTRMLQDKNGKPCFIIVIDAGYSCGELSETVLHEFTGHMSKYRKVLNEYLKNNNYNQAEKVWNSSCSQQEHEEMKLSTKQSNSEVTKNYNSTKKELLKMFPFLQKYLTNE